ncbi:tyrosine-type recombinase/integrase [Clostridium paraputrificum]|uniref:tyrosine-type recombinase/integrase n=1 Tax=Clostridium paraputrificum TaxID=29363 RepID=UPI0018A06EF9|nr:site-specific integrase [Clostridium paraputrificum]
MARKTNRLFITTEEELAQINPANIELRDDFLDYLETTDHSKTSIVTYKNNIDIFFIYILKHCKNKDFVDVKKKDIMSWQGYMVKNGLSSARIRTIKSTISSMSKYIENILEDEEPKWKGYRNLIPKIPNPTLSNVREKTVLSDDELEFLLDELVKRNKVQIATFVAFSAFSGARKAETIQYKREWFVNERCKNGLYITPEIRTKGHGSQGKLLEKYCIKSKVDKYLELIDKFREDNNITSEYLFVTKRKGEWVQAKVSTVDSWMETCTKILGKPNYAHMYRHFFVSYLNRENLPIDVIKDIVGHNDSSTTMIYNDNPKENGFMKYFSEDGIKQVETKSLSDL